MRPGVDKGQPKLAGAGPAAPAPKFVTGSLMRHVVVMALSGTLALSFTFLIDFLALWWISRLKDERLIAAVGIGGMIQFTIMSVSIGLMIACVAMVSRALGMGNRERARHIATSSVLLTVAVQGTLTVLVYLFRRPVLVLSGAEGDVLDLADHFLSVSLPSMPLIAVGILASGILRALGDAWRSMLVTILAGGIAAVLDPILIVWAEGGITGAAVSILIARGAMAAAGLYYIIRKHGMLAAPDLFEARSLASPYFAIALPAIATQLSPPFGSWAMTRAIAEHGDSAIAGLGVVGRLTVLAFGGIFALSGAIGGIIGQNHGADRPDRVAAAFRAALVYAFVYTLVVWAAMAALTGPVIASFGLSEGGADVVRAFTHVAAGSFVFTGVLFVSNATFNNLGRPLWSTVANWTRDALLLWPLAVLMGQALGAVGVIWAQAAANIVAGIGAGWIAARFIAGLVRARESTQAAERAASADEAAEVPFG
jgi:putative MATE family efflux protein